MCFTVHVKYEIYIAKWKNKSIVTCIHFLPQCHIKLQGNQIWKFGQYFGRQSVASKCVAGVLKRTIRKQRIEDFTKITGNIWQLKSVLVIDSTDATSFVVLVFEQVLISTYNGTVKVAMNLWSLTLSRPNKDKN